MANTSRMNRLEELGRVDAEKAYTGKGKRNLRDEKKRIVRELKADGGDVTRPPRTKRPKAGPKMGGSRKKVKPKVIEIGTENNIYPKGMRVLGSTDEKIHKKPHATKEGSWASIKRASKRFHDNDGTYKIGDYGDKSLDIQWKAENKARKNKMAKGGSPKKPRPHGPHMWVKGDRVKKRGGGLSQTQQHYVQHGYGPYKSSGKVLKGKKIGIQIK